MQTEPISKITNEKKDKALVYKPRKSGKKSMTRRSSKFQLCDKKHVCVDLDF